MSTAPATEIDRVEIAQDAPGLVVTRPDEQSAASVAEQAPSVVKNVGGRPTKWCPQVAQAIVSAVEDGCPVTHAARAAGICFQSLCEYRRLYPEFDQQLKEAISRGIQSRIGIVKKAMSSPDLNIALRAATWALTHCPESAPFFAESRRVEIDGELDGRLLVLVWPHNTQNPPTNGDHE